MKSKPEYHHVFASIPFFYRVLHIISTQRFRLPVRRYILELFNIELDSAVVNALVAYSKTLKDTGATTSPSNTKTRLQPRISVFGRPVKHGRQQSDSDMEDDSMDSDEEEQDHPPIERPLSLPPARRVNGFDGTDQDEGQPAQRTADNSVSRRSTWRGSNVNGNVPTQNRIPVENGVH